MILHAGININRVAVFTAALVLFVFVQSAAMAQDKEQPQALPFRDMVIETSDGQQTVEVEIADTADERSKGLMYRTEMPARRGMLFVFEDEVERYFWMKNTPLSLDILFATEKGRIIHIARNTSPYSERLISSRAPARYVLELKAGQANALGLRLGNRFIIPQAEK